jgi:hypothetical protein
MTADEFWGLVILAIVTVVMFTLFGQEIFFKILF